jgi:hypothetical protein
MSGLSSVRSQVALPSGVKSLTTGSKSRAPCFWSRAARWARPFSRSFWRWAGLIVLRARDRAVFQILITDDDCNAGRVMRARAKAVFSSALEHTLHLTDCHFSCEPSRLCPKTSFSYRSVAILSSSRHKSIFLWSNFVSRLALTAARSFFSSLAILSSAVHI